MSSTSGFRLIRLVCIVHVWFNFDNEASLDRVLWPRSGPDRSNFLRQGSSGIAVSPFLQLNVHTRTSSYLDSSVFDRGFEYSPLNSNRYLRRYIWTHMSYSDLGRPLRRARNGPVIEVPAFAAFKELSKLLRQPESEVKHSPSDTLYVLHSHAVRRATGFTYSEPASRCGPQPFAPVTVQHSPIQF